VKEPFVMTPVRLLEDERLTDTAVRVYGLIFRWERKRKAPYPGRKLLAAQLGRSLDTIDRAIRLLENTGWITVEERPGKPHLFHRADGRIAAPERPSRAHSRTHAAGGNSRTAAAIHSRTGAAPGAVATSYTRARSR
jgi:DNA-binding transcriptional MocR family regulator